MNFSRYYRRAFDPNIILYNKSLADTLKVFELLDSLNNNELDKMADFLVERYLYITVNFPKLAERIAKVYCDLGWKSKFIDILSDCECNNILDREHILHIKQLWY